MLLLIVALVAVTVAAVAVVALPLLRGAPPAVARAAYDRAVYRHQLQEVERDVERGVLAGAQVAAARLEIERHLLGTDAPATVPAVATAGSPRLALALAIVVPLAALALYVRLGSPTLPDQPYAARGEERALLADRRGEIEKVAADIEAKLGADSKDAEGWLLLGRARAALGQLDESAAAYARAMTLTNGRPDVAEGYGEVLVAQAEGTVTPQAREAFAVALAADPANAGARYYLALEAAQGGRAQEAIDAWQKLAGETPADSPLRSELQARIAETASGAGLPVPALAAAAAASAPGPTTGDVDAAMAMTPDQRDQMIRGMVEGLAAKLQANPADLEGWLRLARAYAVLGERDKAADAFERAAALSPNDPAILVSAIDALMKDDPLQTPISDRVLALLKRIEALDGKQPGALWLLGLAAAQRQDPAGAKIYWERLLALLPPDSEQHKTVSAALAAIAGK